MAIHGCHPDQQHKPYLGLEKCLRESLWVILTNDVKVGGTSFSLDLRHRLTARDDAGTVECWRHQASAQVEEAEDLLRPLTGKMYVRLVSSTSITFETMCLNLLLLPDGAPFEIPLKGCVKLFPESAFSRISLV